VELAHADVHLVWIAVFVHGAGWWTVERAR
jgi:hypothetical protein